MKNPNWNQGLKTTGTNVSYRQAPPPGPLLQQDGRQHHVPLQLDPPPLLVNVPRAGHVGDGGDGDGFKKFGRDRTTDRASERAKNDWGGNGNAQKPKLKTKISKSKN